MGTNAKLAEFAYAVALRQLAVLEDRVRGRQELSRRYAGSLEPLGFSFQPGAEHSAVAFVSALAPEGANRDVVLRSLSDDDIQARAYYNPPVDEHFVFAGCEKLGALPVTRALASRILSLPTRTNMSQSHFERVINAISRALPG